MKYKKFVATCPAGLGNRIKCMISVLKRCDEDNYANQEHCSSPFIYWPVNDACGCKFEELFSPATPLKEIGYSELQGVRVDAKYDDAYINKSWKFKFNNVAEMDFKYHKLPQDWIIDFLPYAWRIKPKKDIEDAAWAFCNRYKESFDKNEVIGVHIRKGDFKGLYDGRENVSKEEDFMERMKCLLEVNPDYKFLLCTEDEETEERFKRRFDDNHIIHFPKRFRGRDNPLAVKEAFVDILLLSKCPIIIGTFLSTFTEIAWWLGNCRAQVVIPGTEDKEAVARVLDKLPQDGEWIHKKMIRKIKLIGERLGLYG